MKRNLLVSGVNTHEKYAKVMRFLDPSFDYELVSKKVLQEHFNNNDLLSDDGGKTAFYHFWSVPDSEDIAMMDEEELAERKALKRKQKKITLVDVLLLIHEDNKPKPVFSKFKNRELQDVYEFLEDETTETATSRTWRFRHVNNPSNVKVVIETYVNLNDINFKGDHDLIDFLIDSGETRKPKIYSKQTKKDNFEMVARSQTDITKG